MFDESVLPFLKEHEIVNSVQFFINQLLVSGSHDTRILYTQHCEIYIIRHKNIIYVTK